MRYSDLAKKSVVNLKSGKNLGRVCDLCFSEHDFVIRDFFVCPPQRCVHRWLPWFFPNEEIRIRVNDIINIGEDVILVEIS